MFRPDHISTAGNSGGPDAMGIVERDLTGQREADDLGGEEEIPQPDGADAPAVPPPAKN